MRSIQVQTSQPAGRRRVLQRPGIGASAFTSIPAFTIRKFVSVILLTALSLGAAWGFTSDSSSYSRNFSQTAAQTNSPVMVTVTITNRGTAAVRGFWYSEQMPTGLTLTPLSVTVNGQSVTNYVFETGQDGDAYPGCTPCRWVLETPLAFAQNHPLATNAVVQVIYSLSSSNAGAFALAQFSWCGGYTNSTNATFGYSETNDQRTLIVSNAFNPAHPVLTPGAGLVATTSLVSFCSSRRPM